MGIMWFITNGFAVAWAAAAFIFSVPYARETFSFFNATVTLFSAISFFALRLVHKTAPLDHPSRKSPNLSLPLYQPKRRLIDIGFDVVFTAFLGFFAPWVAVVYFLHMVFLQLNIDTLIQMKKASV